MGSLDLLLKSHVRTDPSTDPEKATVDSSLKQTQLTLAACPLNFRIASPVVTFHTITDLSIPQDSSKLFRKNNQNSNIN